MTHINRMVVSGVDLYEKYGLVFGDAYENPLPPVINNYIDVPGRDGPLDYSEFSGDVRYSQRTPKFVFFKPPTITQKEFEQLKTELATFLHGKRHDYTLAIDPGYTYTGRLSVDPESMFSMDAGFFTITGVCDPYKIKEITTYRLNAAGGIHINLLAGRMKTIPIFEVKRRTLISKNDRTWELPPGTTYIRDLYLSGPTNHLTINSYPEYDVAYWRDDPEISWIDSMPENIWAYETAGNIPIQTSSSWIDDENELWITDAEERWYEELYPAAPDDEFSVFIQCTWKDL